MITTTRLRDLEIIQVDMQRFVSFKLATVQESSKGLSILDNELHLTLTESEAWRISEELHEILSKKYIPDAIYLDTVITRELFDVLSASKELRTHFGSEGFSIVNTTIASYIPEGCIVQFKRVNTKDYNEKRINIDQVPVLTVRFLQLNQS